MIRAAALDDAFAIAKVMSGNAMLRAWRVQVLDECDWRAREQRYRVAIGDLSSRRLE